MSTISYEDLSNAVYDPHDPKYQDTASLDNELERTFDLCNSCRMCFKYCPSFPSLFEAMDRVDGKVSDLRDKDKDKVIGECFQCRICYVVCPYTETDKHPYSIDFPALMLRAKVLKARKKGIKLRERLLGNPDLLGRLNSTFLSFIVNWAMKNKAHRLFMHTALGIHKKKLMPSFYRTSFASWFRKYEKRRKKNIGSKAKSKVLLFSTCFVNYNNPQIGKDSVSVLEKNQALVEHPKQNCCGMPALESGNLKLAEKKIKGNIRRLLPYVEKDYKIVAVNPTCSLTLKKEYGHFLEPGQWREDAKKISQATMDLHEYLFELKKEGKFNLDFKSSPGKIAYHVPCHLRAQNIGFRSRDMMRLIPETSISPVAECCGHNGTWAMKKEYFAMSLEAGGRAFEALRLQSPAMIATDCPLAALQLKQGLKTTQEPLHPIQVLARAYREPEEKGHAKALGASEGSGNAKDQN